MFIDWNRNNKIDPVDIGISIAASGAETADTIQIGDYTFKFVQELIPEKSPWGRIKTFDPKRHYAKKDSKPLNKYGNGPFCRFAINSSAYDRVCGVYALLDDDSLLYIGQTVDLQQRYNSGYGNIAPVNCYVGGQSTNCKINSMVLQKYRSGNHVYLFFYETDEFDRVEHELIDALDPPYNSTYAQKYEKHVRTSNVFDKEINVSILPARPATEPDKEFEEIWQRIILCAGQTFITINKVSFQYAVKGDQLYPLHITGAVPKISFEKAYELGAIHNVAQLRVHGVSMPSYVYAIMTDNRIWDPKSNVKPASKPKTISNQTHAVQKIQKTDFCIGDRVEHFQFGKGTVKAIQPVNGDTMITVCFDGSEEKRLVERFAKLKKQGNPRNDGSTG